MLGCEVWLRKADQNQGHGSYATIGTTFAWPYGDSAGFNKGHSVANDGAGKIVFGRGVKAAAVRKGFQDPEIPFQYQPRPEDIVTDLMNFFQRYIYTEAAGIGTFVFYPGIDAPSFAAGSAFGTGAYDAVVDADIYPIVIDRCFGRGDADYIGERFFDVIADTMEFSASEGGDMQCSIGYKAGTVSEQHTFAAGDFPGQGSVGNYSSQSSWDFSDLSFSFGSTWEAKSVKLSMERGLRPIHSIGNNFPGKFGYGKFRARYEFTLEPFGTTDLELLNFPEQFQAAGSTWTFSMAFRNAAGTLIFEGTGGADPYDAGFDGGESPIEITAVGELYESADGATPPITATLYLGTEYVDDTIKGTGASAGLKFIKQL